MRELEGEWRVERLGGLLPPMVGIWKRVHGVRGETWFGILPVWPFRIERRVDRVALVYRPPFSRLVDELRPEASDSWLGRTMIGNLELGRFRMTRSKPRSSEGAMDRGATAFRSARKETYWREMRSPDEVQPSTAVSICDGAKTPRQPVF